jgi:hypothetical protein
MSKLFSTMGFKAKIAFPGALVGFFKGQKLVLAMPCSVMVLHNNVTFINIYDLECRELVKECLNRDPAQRIRSFNRISFLYEKYSLLLKSLHPFLIVENIYLFPLIYEGMD